MSALLVAYLNGRDAARANAVEALLAGLTERERGLVEDAAVMGYVQGMRHAEQPYPGNQHAVALVIDACIAFADLYPTLTGWTPADDETEEGP